MHFNTLFVHVCSRAIPKFEILKFVVQAARLFWQMLSAVIHLHGNRVCLPGFFGSRDTGAQFPQLFCFGSTLLRLFTATSSWTSSKSPFADTILDRRWSYHIPYQSISYIPAFIYVSLWIPHTCQYDMLIYALYIDLSIYRRWCTAGPLHLFKWRWESSIEVGGLHLLPRYITNPLLH